MTTKTFSCNPCNPCNPCNSFPLRFPGFSATLLFAALCLLASPARAATNDLTTALQRGLFEEEANQNLGAAIQAYQSVASQFDKDRKLAATAIFRLGECYRKQGNTNDAAAQYERILREFSDQPTLVTLSRQSLAETGGAPTAQSQASGLAPAPAPATATEAEEVKRIQAMIKDSPDLINATDASGFQRTPLHRAAWAGQLVVAQFLLENGAEVDAKDQQGDTPLHDAARAGHKAMVELLLSHKANVQAPGKDWQTPLHRAAENGFRSVVEVLLAHGADVNAKMRSGSTPLLVAVVNGFRSVAELLLAHGADVNARTSEVLSWARGTERFTGTALDVAAKRGDQALVELLLANKADVTAADESGDTPLHLAAGGGHLAVAEALLSHGADVNAKSSGKNTQGWTPLHYAVGNNQKDMAALLLKHKADPNARIETSFGEGGPGYTPLLIATARVLPDIVDVLLAAGADPNLGNDTRAPILNALNNENPVARLQMLKSLLQHGATLEARDSQGNTPLLLAAWRADKEAMALLLANKADMNAQDNYGRSPLHVLALLNQNRDVKPLAELLVAAGADVNARNKDGNTPLYIAVDRKERELAELLLANKADPNERNNSGSTPLDVAKSQAQPAQGLQPGIPGNPPPIGVPVARLQRVAPGTTAAAPGQKSEPETMADLLRRHGALDDLPKVDRIMVQRRATGDSSTLFTKGAQDWGQFTLLDLIGVEYAFLAASPEDGGGGGRFRGGVGLGGGGFGRGGGYSLDTFLNTFPCLPFPDLAHVRIRRPAPDLKSWQERVVDLRPVFESGDCSKDARLEWGDVVELPEADHPLNEKWRGFSNTELANLKKCLTRQVQIVINGQATNITLAPEFNHLEAGWMPTIVAHTPFWLKPALLQSKLVLTSSDLRHVKVTQHNPATGQTREWVVDCSNGSPSPDLWLRDGDKIEVPEKTAASAAEEATPAPPSSPGQPAAARYTQHLQKIIQREPASSPGNPLPPPAYGGAAPAGSLAINPATGLPLPAYQAPAPMLPSAPVAQASATFAQRYGLIVPKPAPATPPVVEAQYLNVGGVLYSPKANDHELLQAGYHRDHSAKTRKAECWEQRASADLKGRGGNVIWTGADLIEFGGEGMGRSFDDGARYCFAEDTWAALPRKGAPSSRSGHAMVWTGKEMIIWGGFGGVWGNNTNRNDGARYNPASDTWKPVTTKNAPSARLDFPAVWTGREMLLWGGYADVQSRYHGYHIDAHLDTGGRYDPSSDSWKTISAKGAPSKRCCHTLVWTGKEMIVWGGGNAATALNDGARYNPARDSWKPISPDGAPSPRLAHVAFWTGKEMLVWGGTTRETDTQGDYFENGARYNPETDTWRPISTISAPKGRVIASAVWTGSEMVIWGGVNDAQAGGVGDPSRYVGTGARYNPATDAWTEMTTTGAPSPRVAASGVWTGEGLLTFGGYNGTHFNDTWFYSPSRTLYPYVKE